MDFFMSCMRHFFSGTHLEGMRMIRQLGFLALASLTFMACNAKDTLLSAKDGAADQDAGGPGTGGVGSPPGTGGIAGSGGSGGTIVSGTGGGGGVGGNGGAGLGGSGGNLGSGGAAKDGGQADKASDVALAVDAPVSDDGANCGTGYPVGSQKPQGDGCNTCYCESGGYWLCTSKQCQPGPEVGAEVSADAGQCPAGLVWCPGCTPGTGSCGAVCTGAPCLAPDAGCDGSGCSTRDAATAPRDATGLETGATTCSQVTTQAECDVRGDCHSLFRTLGACGCGSAGCCMRFLSCADGASATCTAPTAFGCTIPSPVCDSPYVTSYTPNCFEGCVKSTECK